MNKPITSRVRQATSGSRGVQEPLLNVGAAGVRGGAATRKQASPLKKVDSAGDIVKKNSTEKTPSEPGLIAQGRASGGNSSLISGASKVSGTSSTIPRATDINAAASSAESGKSGFTGSTSIGGAIQRNIAARIDKAGELNRARRDARRAGKSGAGVNAAPSAEKVARDARVDAVIGGNSSASALDNIMPSVDFSGMGVKAKGTAKPSAQDIRKEGRAARAQVRQDRLAKNQASRGEAKDARVASRKAGKDLKNADRIFGKNNVEVTADKGPSSRENKKALRQTSRANVSANGTPEKPENKSMVSAAQMRMNSNVGMKSKSPMKKGYFNKK